MPTEYNWTSRTLDYDEMREARKGFYDAKYESLSLDKSVEYNTGAIVRKARLSLGKGLLFLGYQFPYGSDSEDPLEPEHIEEEDEADWDDED